MNGDLSSEPHYALFLKKNLRFILVTLFVLLIAGIIAVSVYLLKKESDEMKLSTPFQIESFVPNLEAESNPNIKTINKYLKRLKIFPLENRKFNGNGQIIRDLSLIRVRLLPLSQLEEDQRLDPLLKSRALINVMNASGQVSIYYFSGSFKENGTVIEIPVYINTDDIRSLNNETRGAYISEVVLFATFLNFREVVPGDNPFLEFNNKVGNFREDPITWIREGLRLVIKPAFAQVCLGTIDCGRQVYGPGTCSVSGFSPCSNSGQCPVPGEQCQLPEPTCVYDGGNTADCSFTTYPSCNLTCAGGSCPQQGSCVASCTPNCSGKVCGESNGCGGSCPTTGYSTWSGWSCGACTNPGGCGNITLTQNCTRTNQCGGTENMTQACGGACNECGPHGSQSCGNWTQTYDCQGPVSGCTECGPYISAWSAWSACTAPSFTRTRTRTCSENCGTDNCAGVALSQTEDCRGSITGTFFDASIVDDCSAFASQPKISGVDIDIQATVNHSTSYPASTDANGLYNRTGLPVPDSYDLTYDVDDTQWVESPAKFLCDGSLTGISLSTQGQAVTRRVGLYRVFGGWYQVQGGDIGAEEGISVTLPSTCVLPANQASCGAFSSGGSVYVPLIRDSQPAAGTGYPGVAYSTSLSLGGASSSVVSSNDRNTDSTYDGREYDHGFYLVQTARLSRQDWNGVSKPSTDADGEIFVSSGDITIGSDWDLGGGGVDERMFIVHDGNVTITSNLNVVQGSYLGIVASGNITFASNVTQAEGVFIADNINIASTNDTATEQQFIGEGTFIGWSGVQLGRDRGVSNNSGPSELFIFRPDFILNAFDGVRTPEVRWQEVAP